jgi:methylmalonyl-CoA mutase C-terminal domain/subunit
MTSASVADKKIRALFAILSTDVHTRGSIIIANEMSEAGMEVIYLGFRQTPQMVASAAEAEDVDVICLSTHEGFHTQLFPKLIDELKQRGLNIPIVAGGNIQEKEKASLESIGVTGNFGPGTPLKEIVDHVRKVAVRRC